jgi:hypothetical protein
MTRQANVTRSVHRPIKDRPAMMALRPGDRAAMGRKAVAPAGKLRGRLSGSDRHKDGGKGAE